MSNRSALRHVNLGKLAERFLIELGPALVFVVALQTSDLVVATSAFIVAMAVAAGYSWFAKGHFPYMPVGMLILAAVFGGLTIVFGEAAYIEFRATVVNAAGAAAILVALYFDRLILKDALQEGFRMRDDAWHTLSILMAIYLAALAGLNELIWRNFSTETWAWFKAATPVTNALFLIANWPLIRKNLIADGDEAARDEPEPGALLAAAPTIRKA